MKNFLENKNRFSLAIITLLIIIFLIRWADRFGSFSPVKGISEAEISALWGQFLVELVIVVILGLSVIVVDSRRKGIKFFQLISFWLIVLALVTLVGFFIIGIHNNEQERHWKPDDNGWFPRSDLEIVESTYLQDGIGLTGQQFYKYRLIVHNKNSSLNSHWPGFKVIIRRKSDNIVVDTLNESAIADIPPGETKSIILYVHTNAGLRENGIDPYKLEFLFDGGSVK